MNDYREPICANPPAKWCHLCLIAPRDCYRFDPEQLFFTAGGASCGGYNEDGGKGRHHDLMHISVWQEYGVAGGMSLEFDACYGMEEGWRLTGFLKSEPDPAWVAAVFDWVYTHPLKDFKSMKVRDLECDWQLFDSFARQHPEYRPLPMPGQLAML